MDSSSNPTLICSLPDAARHFNLDAKVISRLRRLLAGLHIRPRRDHTLYFKLSDIEWAMRLDAANQMAGEVIDHTYYSTAPCAACGAPMSRLWFEDRCRTCGAGQPTGRGSSR